MYIIIKQGVYVQGLWVEDSLEKAEALRQTLLNLDVDDYHQYVIVTNLKLGEDVLEITGLPMVTKTMQGFFTVKVGSIIYYATTECPDMTNISVDESMKFIHQLSDGSKYKDSYNDGVFQLKRFK